MLLTRKTDYALVALAGLARHPAAYASARDLAGQLQLPLPVLRNILKQLAAAGLLASTRGPSGGYKLAVDSVGAGVGETVLVLDEGNSARQLLEVEDAPVRTVIVGIVDAVQGPDGALLPGL